MVSALDTPVNGSTKRKPLMAKSATASRTAEPDANRAKALDQAVIQIERAYGKGSIMRLDDDPANLPEGIGTGSISLDLALGGRGIPRGRVVEVYGPESSGKTTLTLHAIASGPEGRRRRRLHRRRARPGPVPGPDASASTSRSCSSPSPIPASRRWRSASCWSAPTRWNSIVVDSVAALIPRAEIEGEMGDSHVGLQARLMSQALRKLTGAINRLPSAPSSSSTRSARRSA